MDLMEAEYIKNTQQLQKKYHDPDNHNDVVTHLEPENLECEVKQVLGSINMNKASGGDGILVELFQILKDDTVKVLHSICQQIWKLNRGHRTGKVSFHSNAKERQCQRMFKLLHSCTHLTCQQRNAENSPSCASTVPETRPSRCSSWIQKRQKNQRSNCQHLLDRRESERVPEKYLLLLH